jgi:hypothetical protein
MENVFVIISFLAVAYQKLTESIVAHFSERVKKIILPSYICFIFSASTCYYGNVGILNLFIKVPIWFDAIITGFVMTFAAGIVNDIAGFVQAKKEFAQDIAK